MATHRLTIHSRGVLMAALRSNLRRMVALALSGVRKIEAEEAVAEVVTDGKW